MSTTTKRQELERRRLHNARIAAVYRLPQAGEKLMPIVSEEGGALYPPRKVLTLDQGARPPKKGD